MDDQSHFSINTDTDHSARITGAAFISDDRTVTWSEDRTIRTWSTSGGIAERVIQGHSYIVEGVEELPDGTLLSWSTDGTVRRWNPESGEELDCWERKDAPQEYQDMADAGGRWQQPKRRSRGGTFIEVAGEQVHWAGIGEWSCWAVREDGTLLLSKGSEFRVIHLYRGLGRVGIDGEALA
jgi:WD40 repeat protein